MSETSRSYDDWKAPSEDGRMLIWPEPPRLLADAQENARRLTSATHVRLQGVPLPEVRRQARHFIGHTLDERPLVATGHQTELSHPGVWVKNALIHAVARALGGAAFHFAVDTDAPKHLHLRWPGGSRAITDDPALTTGAWSGLVAPPTPQHLASLQEEFEQAAASWEFHPSIDPFFAQFRRLLLEPKPLPVVLTNAVHALEWDLGLRHHALVLSPLWIAEPYLVLLHHLLASADEFGAAYNRSLRDYRIANGISALSRPMPNLEMAHEVCEVPFWLDDLATGTRERARARREPRGAWEIRLTGGERFTFDRAMDGWEAAHRLSSWLRLNQVRLAPRALTLTLFFRLLLADQFIHGIGGGRYDQVTDTLIETFFGMEPPRFAVTTATMYFPAAVGQRRINLKPLLQEGRRIRHGLLSREKREAVAQIAALPRGSSQRRELFFRMHSRLAAESAGPAVQRWEAEFRAAERRSAEQRVLFDRELFFAIQPRERLISMIGRYDKQFV